MNIEEIKQLAADFLASRKIGFVPSGEVYPMTSNRSEVVFLVPEALDPDVVVDPPDVRVIVDHNSGACELVDQM
jgi:hypothetical protein